jgi:hypothetical protein
MRDRLIDRSAAARVVRRRGVSILFVIIFLVVLIAFVSLAVDIGRVRLARAELQTAADAAARAGARSLPASNQAVLSEATYAGTQNPVIDAEDEDATHLGERTNPGVALDENEDILFGHWVESTDGEAAHFEEIFDDPSTHRDERRAATAVRTWGRRLEERGNPVPLIFAPIVGALSTNIERHAVARISDGPAKFGFVGLDSVTGNGTGSVIDSMRDGKSGAGGGGIASDGDINLGNADVYGDVRPGMDVKGKPGRIIQGPQSTLTGWTANLDYKLRGRAEFKPAKVPMHAMTFVPPPKNGDWVIPPEGVTPGTKNNHAVYKINAVKLNGNKQIQIRGYVDLYVTGNVDIQGSHVINDGTPSDPAQFTIYVVGAGTRVDIGGNVSQYLHLFAPESDVVVHGGARMQYYGWIIGQTLCFGGSSNLHYDESRTDSNAFKIRLVE